MDILETTDNTSRRHALMRGLNHEMLSTLAIFPAPKDESFDVYVEHLNEQDCRLHLLNTHSCLQPQHRLHPPTTATTAATTATGIAAGPVDLSAARGRLSTAERSNCRAQGLCMYCGGVGHFAAEFPAQRNSLNRGTAARIGTAARTGIVARLGRHVLAGASTVLTPDGSDSESGNEEAQE